MREHLDEAATDEGVKIVDFLLARITEAEQRYASSPSEYGYGHAFRMAECRAKRQLVERIDDEWDHLLRRDDVPDATVEDLRSFYGEALAILALPYADHPDYRGEWRP